MNLTDWIDVLRCAGVTRVTLDLGATLRAAPLVCNLPADQAPRDPVTNAQAESPHVHSEPADEADPDQRARDLELMHSDG